MDIGDSLSLGMDAFLHLFVLGLLSVRVACGDIFAGSRAAPCSHSSMTRVSILASSNE